MWMRSGNMPAKTGTEMKFSNMRNGCAAPRANHDGLYGPLRSGDDQSPLGPLVAAARVEGYRRQARIMTDEPSPYHGYYFKVLTRQGKHAPGGKYDYIINGHMIGGFALVAWPAEWGNSG